MRPVLPSLACFALLALSACDEVAVAGDPVAVADVRGQRSCVSAVADHTGVAGVAINTTIPVVELNRYVVDVPNGARYTCITNAEGKATQIVEQQTG